MTTVYPSYTRNLALLFWVIATAGMAGYSLSLGASLCANTDRKRRELSVLRLLGFRGGGIMCPALAREAKTPRIRAHRTDASPEKSPILDRRLA